MNINYQAIRDLENKGTIAKLRNLRLIDETAYRNFRVCCRKIELTNKRKEPTLIVRIISKEFELTEKSVKCILNRSSLKRHTLRERLHEFKFKENVGGCYGRRDNRL